MDTIIEDYPCDTISNYLNYKYYYWVLGFSKDMRSLVLSHLMSKLYTDGSN